MAKKEGNVVERRAILAAIDDFFGEDFRNHARRAVNAQQGELDLYVHEDLDELQAVPVADLAKDPEAAPVAAFSFMGARGQSRLRMMSIFSQALCSVGFAVRHRGITRY